MFTIWLNGKIYLKIKNKIKTMISKKCQKTVYDYILKWLGQR